MSTPPEIVLVSHYNLARVKELLAEDPSLLNIMYEPWQETPLGAASHVGNRAIAEYLLEQGASLTIPTAAMLGRVDDVQAFIETDPANVHATGAHGISLLYHAAMSGSLKIVELLKSHGANLETAGHALQGATNYGRLEMVKWLLDHGADPNIPDYQNKTPLALAKANGYDEIAAVLEAAGGKE
ncbi:MAG TPA: ankyrin repeat domain-containing protein [Anaerolineales bacterium]|nr:ankyrin repeat domain-containing protein [Anaerolineales bacterium]